ncbi:tetratricopeptide repeat protein [Desulfovibrio inopinatus]|uniref:tetratricopeptide repeat protein n=1 Tax=Desulfovibrio inopinatus TaxID=102109 RepID=UPI000429545B|nr:tetratricopeptide repeat protein [Desulfovibrio inopinatus]
MYKLSSLLKKLPIISQSRMVSSGLGVWMLWSGSIDQAVYHTMREYGGFMLGEESHQCLWFFFGDEGLRALARLQVWARVNQLPVFFQAIPVTVLVGYKMELSLSIAEDLAEQSIRPPDELEVWVHPNLRSMVTNVPGLYLKKSNIVSGLAKHDWEVLQAAPGLSFESSLGWIYIIRPLGDPLDKKFSEGWRGIYSQIQAMLERLGIKYIFHEGYLIFQLEGLRLFQSWCQEYLSFIDRIKDNRQEGKYWPCVIVTVPRKGHNFSKDLPKKLRIDWKQLTPDFPHMSYRSALLLGGDFTIHEVNYGAQVNSLEDWCNVSLSSDSTDRDVGSLTIQYPSEAFAGKLAPCFYCGLTNHPPTICPSKRIPNWTPETWDAMSEIDMKQINELFGELNASLSKEPVEGMTSMLEETDEKSTLLRAVFEINFASQLRMMGLVWRSRGKELPQGLQQLNEPEGEIIWASLESLRNNDLASAERQVGEALSKYVRAFQPRSLQGNLAMEAGDWPNALYYWQEGARFSYTALQRSYHTFLQGRGLEIMGEYQKAIECYKQAHRECPRWYECSYRQGVCMVKMGFTDQGMSVFYEAMETNPHIFNRLLIDPELERGRLHVLTSLWRAWSKAKKEVEETIEDLPKMSENMRSWFPEENEFITDGDARLAEITRLSKINNYVAYKRVIKGYEDIQNDLRETVDKEIKVLQNKNVRQYDELRAISREAAWFPFPKLLRDFNKDFNFCASKLNWMRTSSQHVAQNFRKSQIFVDEVEERIKTLKARLVTLRIIRDATLFVMLLGRNFVWLEVIGLGLSLVFVPLFIYIFHKTGQFWIADLVERQKWQLQRGLVIILSIIALALAAIKTAVSFEGKKQEIFKKVDDETQKKQDEKKEKIRQAKERRERAREEAREEARKKR